MDFSRRRWLLSAAGSAFFAQVAKAMRSPIPAAIAAAGLPTDMDKGRTDLESNVACGLTHYQDSSGNQITIANSTAFNAALDGVYKKRWETKWKAGKITQAAWDDLLWQSVALGAWMAFVQLREEKAGGAFQERYLHTAREEFGWNRNNIMIPKDCNPTAAPTSPAGTALAANRTTGNGIALTGAATPNSTSSCTLCS